MLEPCSIATLASTVGGRRLSHGGELAIVARDYGMIHRLLMGTGYDFEYVVFQCGESEMEE